MPEILIKYADEKIVGVFFVGFRLNRAADIFLGAKSSLMRKNRIRELFLLCLFAVVKLVVGQGIFHKMLGHVEVIG